MRFRFPSVVEYDTSKFDRRIGFVVVLVSHSLTFQPAPDNCSLYCPLFYVSYPVVVTLERHGVFDAKAVPRDFPLNLLSVCSSFFVLFFPTDNMYPVFPIEYVRDEGPSKFG